MSSSLQQQESSGGPALCAAGCGFFGSPAALNMCSVCYKKHRAVVSGEPAAAKRAVPASRSAAAAALTIAATASSPAAKKPQRIWCAACYKKVGLMGFVCRSSKTTCGSHRYAEEHGCRLQLRL